MPIKIANKKLVKKAKDNTSVTKEKVISKGVKETENVKEGTPLDPIAKREASTIGMAKGVTLNMGDFQSARIDCWLSVPLEDNNYTEKFTELSDIIDEQIKHESTKVKEM